MAKSEHVKRWGAAYRHRVKTGSKRIIQSIDTFFRRPNFYFWVDEGCQRACEHPVEESFNVRVPDLESVPSFVLYSFMKRRIKGV